VHETPGWGRRFAAFGLDWALSVLVVIAVTGEAVWDPDSPQWVSFAVTGTFLLMRTLLDGLLGRSIGHRVLGLAVVRRDGSPVGAWAFVRTLLICLAVPPFIVNRDGRGLHDVAAGTSIVRT
jgi:uncharacterized RDD family membrane protein YckC